MKKTILLLVIATLIHGCKNKNISSIQEYRKWINTPENGLISTKRIKGLKISVKYLPNEYLIYKEVKESKDTSNKSLERVKKEYENGIAFLMTIGPDEEKKNENDIMFEDIKNYKEYTERLMSLNFDMDKNIRLKLDETELIPVLSALENTYGLTKSRNIMFVFSPNEKEHIDFKKSDAIDFIYTDELFSLGIMHFNFKRKDLENLPKLTGDITD